ncbi:MAG: hypothetical protein ACO31E_07490, partial [Phycisphaerales bacterium]
RAAGRPVRLTLDTSRLAAARPESRPPPVDDPAVRNDPLVRKAAELLDASVIAVTPRLADAGADAGDEPDGDADSGTTDAGQVDVPVQGASGDAMSSGGFDEIDE